MGQANVLHWVPDILPLRADEDVLGVDGFTTHHLPLEDAPQAYADFQAKRHGVIKTLLRPWAAGPPSPGVNLPRRFALLHREAAHH